MNIMLYLSIIANILLLLMFLVCYFYSLSKNVNLKIKSSLALFLCGTMIIYFICLLITSLYGLIIHKYIFLILLLFIAVPFVIGNYSSYKKMALYTFIQVVFLALSLFVLYQLL